MLSAANFKRLNSCLGFIQLDSRMFSLGDILDETDFLVTIVYKQKESISAFYSDCTLHQKSVGNL